MDDDRKQEGVPVIALDYAFMGQEGQEGHTKILVVKDWKSKTIMTHVCSRKGAMEDWVCKRVAQEIDDLGYREVILQSDTEHSIKDVRRAIKENRVHSTQERNAPKGDSKANGSIERGVQSAEGQIRALKIQLEKRLQKKIEPDDDVLHWLVEYAGVMLARILKGQDGMTAYRRITGRDWNQEILEFGERVLYKPLKDNAAANKMDERFHEGVWIGFNTHSKEHLIGTPEGVIRARTLRRRPMSERWSHQAVLGVRGTPRNPTPGSESDKVLVRIPTPEEILARQLQGERLDRIPRRVRLEKEYFDDYGFTTNCPGCRNIQEGKPPRNHSEECRKRIEAKVGATEEGRVNLEKASERRDARIAEEVEKDAKKRRTRPTETPTPEQRAASTQPALGKRKAEEEEERAPTRAKTEVSTSSGTPASSSSVPATNTSEKRGRDDANDDMEAPAAKEQRLEESISQAMQMLGVVCSREDVRKIFQQLGEDMMKSKTTTPARQQPREGKYHMCELWSPPRMCKRTQRAGLKGGWSLDLTVTDEDDGEPWDFDSEAKQEKAMRKVREDKPTCIVVSPMCSAFSALQSLNFSKMDPTKVREVIDKGMRHLNFAMKLCEVQWSQGGYFVFEHPWGARSWDTPSVRKVMGLAGVKVVRTDMCQYKMQSEDHEGPGAVLKPTGILTNCPGIAMAMQRRCNGGHRHVSLINGRAKACQKYTDQFCDAVCGGLAKQIRDDIEEKRRNQGLSAVLSNRAAHDTAMAWQRMLCSVEKNPAMTSEMHRDPMEDYDCSELIKGNNDAEFWDDLTGLPLDGDMVRAARKLEMDFFRKKAVYTKVPRSQTNGHKVIAVRWVDINKGDDKRPDYRSRLVAKEINTHKRLDLFAATPPLESLRYLTSACARQGEQGRGDIRMMFNDVKRAYFFAPATREVYVELPGEDASEGMVGRLNLSMYGTRDAAQNWARQYTQTLLDMGFRQGVASPCHFYHPGKDLRTAVHGDDFTTVGGQASLKWMRQELERRYELKTHVLGPDVGESTEVRVLNRIIRWSAEGVTYEPDPRHAEIIRQQLGLQNAKGVTSPGTKEQETEPMRSSPDMDATDAWKYRSIVARCNFLAQDRPDLLFSVKEACRVMSQPKHEDWAKLKRIGRYLIHRPRMVQVMEWTYSDSKPKVEAWGDSDWAGCRVSRKSTSGGVIAIGQHVLKAYSSTQGVVALSSGEAELYALVRAASMAIGMVSMAADFGEEWAISIKTDSSAAQGMVYRQGLGKVRHLDVQQLWIQDRVARKQLAIEKVLGTENCADLMTKFLAGDAIDKIVSAMGFRYEEGRPEAAPEAFKP